MSEMLEINREQIKGVIRIRYGSMAAFASEHGLKAQQVRDCLRKLSTAAKPAIAELLGIDPDHLEITLDSPFVELASSKAGRAHRLNAGAR